jgi:NAD(P)-dependent dehydrogenase (short-subunit alcohol dehydrogenase family)
MQTVIITGSAKRLGRGLAIEFAKKGWNIILHYNSSQDEAMQPLSKSSIRSQSISNSI